MGGRYRFNVVVLLLGKVDQPARIYFGIGLIGKFSTRCAKIDGNFEIRLLLRNSIRLLGYFGYYDF